MNIKPFGASNRFFYYCCSGEVCTFDLRVSIALTNTLNHEILIKSAEKALKIFPEFAVRPVIYKNSVCFIENNNEIPLRPDNSNYYFGTDETNGYPFCFMYRENGFMFSCFHGQSDYWGILRFVNAVLYYYAVELGYEVKDVIKDFVRDENSMDEQNKYFPYENFANPKQIPFWSFKNNGAFKIPEKTFAPDADYARMFNIRCDKNALLNFSKGLSTSLIPLLNIIISSSILNLYELEDLPIISMVPVNLRALYNTKSMSNFSDGILLNYDKKISSYDIERQALILRAKMDLQMQNENFDLTLAGKIKAVENFMASGKNIEDLSHEITDISKPDGFNFMTYACTYPGQLEFDNPIIKYASILICVRQSVPFGTFMAAYKDDFNITLSQGFDSDNLANEILLKIRSLGISASIQDMGHISCNKLCCEKLLKLN